MSAALQNGDTVRFSRSFLQSLAMLSGPAAPTSIGPFARGTVTAIAPLSPGSPLLLATVRWADGHTSQVNVANLERQPRNTAFSASQAPWTDVRKSRQ